MEEIPAVTYSEDEKGNHHNLFDTISSGEVKERTRKAKYWAQLNEALQATSINGLSQACSKSERRYKLFWTCVFVFGVIAFAINLYMITHRFVTYPILTQLEREETPFQWPHFTFCSPANPIPFWTSSEFVKKWSSVMAKAEGYELPKYDPVRQKKIWEHYVGISTINPVEFYKHIVKRSIYKLLITYEDSSIVAYSSAADLYHDVRDFENLFEVRLDTIRSPIPCFTLIPEKLGDTISNETGSDRQLNSIKIYLLMDTSSYMIYDIGFESRKTYFYVTKPNSTILSKFPIYILPGTNSIFEMKEKIHKRISGCTNKIFNLELYDISMRNTRTFNGTFDDCRTFYSQSIFVKTCGCYNPYLPMYKFPDRKPILCTNMSLFNNAEMKKNIVCLNNVLSENSHSPSYIQLIKNRCDEYKNHPCIESRYSVYRIKSTWQNIMSKTREESLILNLRRLPNYKPEYNDTKFQQNNLAIIQLEWGKENAQTTFEEPEYPLSQYMSDVGGIIGLWVGVSAISVFEFIEIMVYLIKYLRAK